MILHHCSPAQRPRDLKALLRPTGGCRATPIGVEIAHLRIPGFIRGLHYFYFLFVQILKYGHPNGIVRLADASLQTTTVSEPRDGTAPVPVKLELYRTEGTIGDLKVRSKPKVMAQRNEALQSFLIGLAQHVAQAVVGSIV